jgi:hypothetical protein
MHCNNYRPWSAPVIAAGIIPFKPIIYEKNLTWRMSVIPFG